MASWSVALGAVAAGLAYFSGLWLYPAIGASFFGLLLGILAGRNSNLPGSDRLFAITGGMLSVGVFAFCMVKFGLILFAMKKLQDL